MARKRFRSKLTEKMKDCYASIPEPPQPIFKTRQYPILILHRLASIIEYYPPRKEYMGGGLFYGAAGVGYALLRCAGFPLYEPIRKCLLLTAKEYADASLKFCRIRQINPVSLLLGEAGMYAVAAVIYKELGYLDQALLCTQQFQAQGANYSIPCYSEDGGGDLCNGLASYLTAALWLKKHFKESFSPIFFYRYLEILIQSCKTVSEELLATAPLAYCHYDMQYVGMMHGLAGILLVILCFPSYLDDHPELEEDVKLSVDCILLRQKNDGRFFLFINNNTTIPDDILKWRSGASGILHLMAKAYLRWRDSRYLYCCMLIGDFIWNYGLQFVFTDGSNNKGGIGLDHGLVGNLYGLLVLYRLTKYPIYLQQAHICSMVLKDEKHHESFLNIDNVYSLFNGSAGIVVYMLALIDINEAEFPFVPVFWSHEE